MDYSRASTYMQLCNDDFCSVPEFTGVAIRMGRRPPPVILGTLHDDPSADAEILEWCHIAMVLHDLKTCIAMLVMDRLDIGGSFAEFHPIDFHEGFVLVGHDGPHHINIANGKPLLRSLRKYHGKPGSGASVEFKIREGPITMLSLGVTGGGRFKFVIAEGESVDGPIPATGNTNTRGFFQPDVRTFLKRWVAAGPTHHFALGVGHHAAALVRIARILDIENVIVTPHEPIL